MVPFWDLTTLLLHSSMLHSVANMYIIILLLPLMPTARTEMNINQTLVWQTKLLNFTPIELEIKHLEDETLHNLLNLTKTQSIIFQTLIGVNFVSGNFYHYLLFKLVWNDGRFQKPINIMTVADESIKMVGYSYWIIIQCLAEHMKEPIAHLIDQSLIGGFFTGKSFCRFSQAISTMGYMHGYVGGVGIALMRLMFIRYPDHMPFGQMSTALLLTGASLVVTSVASCVWMVTPRQSQDVESFCLGHPGELDKTLYRLAIPKHEQSAIITAILVFGFVLTMTEFFSYASICSFLIKHDKMMRLVLSEELITRRIRRNVITLGGHMLNFAIEIILIVFALRGTYWWQKNPKIWLRFYSLSHYGILGAFHIWFSPPIRRSFMDSLNWLITPCMRLTSQGEKKGVTGSQRESEQERLQQELGYETKYQREGQGEQKRDDEVPDFMDHRAKGLADGKKIIDEMRPRSQRDKKKLTRQVGGPTRETKTI